MTTRSEVAEALNPLMPKDIAVTGYPKQLEPFDADTRAKVVVERRSIGPGSTQSSYIERFNLWVVTDLRDEEQNEDELDAATDDVLEALRVIPWIGWTDDAERTMYDEQKSAYRIPITIKGKKETTP